MLLTDLLTVLIPRIDHSRVVRTFQQSDHIPLIQPYLIAVQHVSMGSLCPSACAQLFFSVEHRGGQRRLQPAAH